MVLAKTTLYSVLKSGKLLYERQSSNTQPYLCMSYLAPGEKATWQFMKINSNFVYKQNI